MIARTKNTLRWFFSKVGLQVLSVGIALAAWFVVNSGQRVTVERKLQINYSSIPNGLSFQRSPLKEATIELTGSLYRLRSIQDSDLVYPVDVSNARPGPLRIEIEPERLKLPLDIVSAHPSPRAFLVHFEEVFVREVPLREVLVGQPQEGFAVSRVTFHPPLVSVTGPRSLVSKIDHVDVDVVVADKSESFAFETKPKMPIPETTVSSTIMVEVEVGPLRGTREFSRLPVVAVGATTSVTIEPMEAQILVEGPRKVLDAMKAGLRVQVSVKGLSRGRYRIRGQVELPEDINLVSLEPREFVVMVNQ